MKQSLRNVNKENHQSPAPSSENGGSDKKPKMADHYESVFCAITDSPTRLLPKPPFRIESVILSEGVKTPVHISEQNECKVITLENVGELIMDYARNTLSFDENFRFTAKNCRDCADYWLMASSPIPTPSHVGFLTDAGLCWNRQPYLLDKGPTPMFDELFGRIPNARAVKAFIGSLFIPESYNQQFLWLYGAQGGDGKSSLLEILAMTFGVEGSLAQSTTPSGDHWAEAYPGKRLVYFPDFKDFKSLDSGPLKQITGGDQIFINPKHRRAYVARLICKLIFSANQMPPIENQPALLRRIIFAEVLPTKCEVDTNYVQKLARERGAFFQSCIEIYGEECPTHNPIRSVEDSINQLEAWGSRHEDEFQMLFDTHFKHSPGAETSPTEVARIMLPYLRDTKSKNGWYDWLQKTYRRQRVKRDGKLYWVYKNLGTKINYLAYQQSSY